MRGDKTHKGRWCYAPSNGCEPYVLNHARRSPTRATPAATYTDQATPHRPTLFLAFELGVTTWKLGFTTGMAQRPRERTVAAGDVHGLDEEMTRAKRRFG